MKDYSFMDTWNDQQIAEFKENGKDQQELFINVQKSILKATTQSPKIVSEGDSWFDYLPGTDLIDCLRSNHGYVIKNYGNAGDTLENMIYGTKYFKGSYERQEPTITEILRKVQQIQPDFFLFSGGGNDIAGDEFGSYLNHTDTGLPPLRKDYLNYMINTVYKQCCIDLINKIKKVSPKTKIIMHGYAYTKPTGKGVSLIGFNFAGPWLRPSLTKKNILNPINQVNIVNTVIDEYNKMLKSLSVAYPNFYYIDLRNTIDADNDWANELHLKNSAYAKVAHLINDIITKNKK
ncbi:SGNH/GDSL hydrolase family protein [Acinetobacter tandoii]|uniref:SGNH/GDSL hydrolase family protein n=1 Tax=Acinetobacter tandoii TaxID=202954 RepID=UPI0040457EC9